MQIYVVFINLVREGKFRFIFFIEPHVCNECELFLPCLELFGETLSIRAPAQKQKICSMVVSSLSYNTSFLTALSGPSSYFLS